MLLIFREIKFDIYNIYYSFDSGIRGTIIQ